MSCPFNTYLPVPHRPYEMVHASCLTVSLANMRLHTQWHHAPCLVEYDLAVAVDSLPRAEQLLLGCGCLKILFGAPIAVLCLWCCLTMHHFEGICTAQWVTMSIRQPLMQVCLAQCTQRVSIPHELSSDIWLAVPNPIAAHR